MILTLPVCPTANKWYRIVKGRIVKSREAREYQETVGTLALMQRMPLIEKPTEVAVTIHWYREALHGDLDKRYSIMLDALQGIAFENDSQIGEIHAYRNLDRGNPRMQVQVSKRTE